MAYRGGYYGKGGKGKGQGKGYSGYKMDMADESVHTQPAASYCRYVLRLLQHYILLDFSPPAIAHLALLADTDTK
jgi:hypothetical protein